MSRDLFVIVDESCNVLTIAGIAMFGVKVQMPGIFEREQDALEVLYAVQKVNPEIKPHQVIRIAGSFTAQQLDVFSGDRS